MRKLLIIFFTSIIINPGFTQSYTNHQILSYSGSNANIRVWVSASTSFGMGVSGGLSTDGGANYPYGWGPFNNNVSNPGPGSGTWYRDFTLPTSSTNIDNRYFVLARNVSGLANSQKLRYWGIIPSGQGNYKKQ